MSSKGASQVITEDGCTGMTHRELRYMNRLHFLMGVCAGLAVALLAFGYFH